MMEWKYAIFYINNLSKLVSSNGFKEIFFFFLPFVCATILYSYKYVYDPWTVS